MSLAFSFPLPGTSLPTKAWPTPRTTAPLRLHWATNGLKSTSRSQTYGNSQDTGCDRVTQAVPKNFRSPSHGMARQVTRCSGEGHILTHKTAHDTAQDGPVISTRAQKCTNGHTQETAKSTVGEALEVLVCKALLHLLNSNGTQRASMVSVQVGGGRQVLCNAAKRRSNWFRAGVHRGYESED